MRLAPAPVAVFQEKTVPDGARLADTQIEEARLADLCRLYQVRELSFFGSAARGQMRPDSDIDLVDYAGPMLELSHLLKRRVDLVSKNGLKPLIRASILQEARLLYAA